jgi:hypothetical protein
LKLIFLNLKKFKMSIKAVAVLLGDVARGIIHFEQTVNDFIGLFMFQSVLTDSAVVNLVKNLS